MDSILGLAAICSLVLSPLAASPVVHGDDYKLVDLEAPLAGEGFRTQVPAGASSAAAGSTRSFPSNGVHLLSNMTLSDLDDAGGVSDCWGYVSQSGREYALVGTDVGTSIVEVTNAGNPVLIASMPGTAGPLRDIKTFADKAYVITPAGGGVQVLDLANIDSGVIVDVGSIVIGGALSTHNLAVNADSGFLYRLGGASIEGIRAYDLNQSTTNPPFVGNWMDISIHDAQVVSYTSGPFAGREIAFCLGGLNSGTVNTGLRILDVTDKANMFVRDEVFWPNAAFAHQCWLSDDRVYLYINDELDETSSGLPTTTYVIDVSDLDNAVLASTFDNGNNSVGHNAYVRGDLLIAANYTSGLRVADLLADPLAPPEVAWFDTREADDLQSFNGLFGVYPYLPSGIVLGSDRQAGLFVWWVGDPLLTLTPVNGAPTLLPPGTPSVQLSITELSPGNLVPGSEMLHVDLGGGYQVLPLVPQGAGIFDAVFPTLSCPDMVSFYFSAQSTNGVEWQQPASGACAPFQALVASAQAVSFADDFEVDLGWISVNLGASAGDWERGIPINDPDWAYDPMADSDGSGSCWMTLNRTGDSDVDGGAVRLISPNLDLTAAGASVQYDYYLYLTDEDGTDQMLVEASDNGALGPWKQVARHAESSGTCWRRNLLPAAKFTAAGLSLNSAMHMRFTVTDGGAPSIVEAGLDAFKVSDLTCSQVTSYCTAGTSATNCTALLSAAGNPSATATTGFTLTASSVEGNKDGLFFYGTSGRQANSWGSGTSFQCVVPPVKRGGLLVGVGAAGSCDGTFAQDLNARWCPSCPKANHNPGAGALVQAQLWFRDPFNTSNQTTSLSDALEFTVSP